uniref:Uncharacterized protein n=1 Tax=Arion vulgaris TaxID=1028688 RepID=A0A0B7ARW5_9EUPU
MDRRSVSTLAREQLLHIEEAKYTLHPVVPPISLEHKYISMLNPSKDNQEIKQETQTTKTADMTSSTTVTTAPSLSPTSVTSTAKVAQVSPSVSATRLPATTPTAALEVAASIVGGKRPLGEESPVIIVIEHQDDEKKKETTSDLPGSDQSTRKNQSYQEQPQLRKQKPEKTARNLSTGESTSEHGIDLGRSRSKPGVQFSEVSPKRDVSDIMQFFQEQEKSLQERFLSLPKKSQQKQRSPSPKLQHAAGLEHLDNLIRLMEQLTSLKDENSRLRKRCDYLESTKILLQAKRDLSFESSSSSSGFMTLQPKHKQHEHHPHLPHHQIEQEALTTDELRLRDSSSRLTRPRISSAEELEYIEIIDSSSDQTPKKPKSAMHKRSFSTGSLEVPSEMSADVGRVDNRKRIKGKTGRSIFGKSAAPNKKQKAPNGPVLKKFLQDKSFMKI